MSNDFPIVQYADDTLLIMEADVNQLVHLKGLLDLFALSTGLTVNYSKSSMFPINVHPDRLAVLAAAFDCVTVYAIHISGPPIGYYKAKNGRSDTSYG